MADTALPSLPAASALAGDEVLYLVQGGNSRKIALSDLAQYIKTAATIVPTNLPYKGARVSRTATLALTSGASTTITWQAEPRDTDNFWSAGAPTRLTIPAGVTKVRLGLGARFSASGANTTSRQISMTKNGASFPGRASLTIPGNSQDIICWSDVIDVVAGDYFEATIFHDSGTVNLVNDDRTFFAVQVVETSGA